MSDPGENRGTMTGNQLNWGELLNLHVHRLEKKIHTVRSAVPD
jgi:hypothetical protein